MTISQICICLAIAVYLIAMLGVGVWFSKRNNSVDDFYLGGRKLGPFVTAMSAEASDMSSWLLMGLPGVAYLSGLAEAHGISTGYLSSQLKAELGLSFSEYITSKRIQKAKELLADESLSVESIAEQTGYNDYFYFIKVFKKNTGISPSKYRKNL